MRRERGAGARKAMFALNFPFQLFDVGNRGREASGGGSRGVAESSVKARGLEDAGTGPKSRLLDWQLGGSARFA